MANFLDTFFYSFDYALLAFFHGLAVSFGDVLTPIAIFLSNTCNLPILLVGFIAIALMFTKKYRKIGITIAIAIALGAIITSLLIKPFVLRFRPYQSNVDIYKAWWEFVRCQSEKDSSFPSGHTTAATSSAVAFFIASKNKKISWLALLYPLLIASCRIYLCVHYPSDTLAGLLVGCFAAIMANLIINKIYKQKGLV